MDSAIADMSTEDSFSTELGTQTSDYNAPVTQPDAIGDFCPSKRRRSSCMITQLGFDVRDFGTAASQRPRRGATSQTPVSIALPQTPTRKRKRGAKEISNHSSDTVTPRGGQRLNGETTSQLPAHEVNRNNVEREQTSLLGQAPIKLATPPQTTEKTNIQSAPISSLRRSTREQPPTERSQQLSTSEQITSCRKTTKTSTICIDRNQGEGTPPAQNRESYLVCLRLPPASEKDNTGQPMSFIGSFSHRRKGGDSSQTSQQQVSVCPCQEYIKMLTLSNRAEALLRLSTLRTMVPKPLRSRGRSRYLQIVKNCTLHRSNYTTRPPDLAQQLTYSSTFRPVAVRPTNASVHLPVSPDRTYRDHLQTLYLKLHRNVKIVHTSTP